MTKKLTVEQILDIRDLMAEFARKLDHFRITHSTKIPALIFAELQNWSRQIKDRVFELTGKAINQLLTNLEEPAEKIKEAIKKLEDALRTITTFNNVVNEIADIINVFGIIVRAVSSGLASVNIDAAFTSLNNLI